MMSADDLNVSRETLEKLRAFSALVEKWTAKINLISKPSIPYLWQRHVLDSAQIFRLNQVLIIGSISEVGADFLVL